jgi:hypothetical protein
MLIQEAATSTQEGSSDSQSSNEDKIIIAFHKETEQTELVLGDPLEVIENQTTNHVSNE